MFKYKNMQNIRIFRIESSFPSSEGNISFSYQLLDGDLEVEGHGFHSLDAAYHAAAALQCNMKYRKPLSSKYGWNIRPGFQPPKKKWDDPVSQRETSEPHEKRGEATP